MELVRGRTLREHLDEQGRLEPVEVVHIGAEVADALDLRPPGRASSTAT